MSTTNQSNKSSVTTRKECTAQSIWQCGENANWHDHRSDWSCPLITGHSLCITPAVIDCARRVAISTSPSVNNFATCHQTKNRVRATKCTIIHISAGIGNFSPRKAPRPNYKTINKKYISITGRYRPEQSYVRGHLAAWSACSKPNTLKLFTTPYV